MDKKQWLDPQPWERDVNAPCLSLGATGQFDDTHLFAPCVALENERYYMWYKRLARRSGSTGFCSGGWPPATTACILHDTPPPRFAPWWPTTPSSPPTLVRHPDGSLRREAGKLCMFFSSTDFPSGGKRHTLHAMTSDDGLRWEAPSRAPIRKRLRPHPVLGRRPLPSVVHRCERRSLDHTRRPQRRRLWVANPSPAGVGIGPGMGVPAPDLSSRSQRGRLLSDVVRQL